MDLSAEPAREAWRAEVCEWLATNVPPEPLPSLDTAEGFAAHRDWERRLADARLSVVTWPEDYGGRGAGLLDWLGFGEGEWGAGGPPAGGQKGPLLPAPPEGE